MLSVDDYDAYLAHERHMFAWCLIMYGGRTAEQAKHEAQERYPYQDAFEPNRWLVFHDMAWHWAMLWIHGEHYWIPNRELESAPDEYRRESERVSQHPYAAR